MVSFSFPLEGGGPSPQTHGEVGGWGTLLLCKPSLFRLEAKLVEKGQRKEFACRDVEAAPKLQQALNSLIISL